MTNRLKKTAVALTLVLVLACAVAFPWLAIVKKDKKATDITLQNAVYGTMYYLPKNAEGEVFDSENKQIDLTKEKGFFVEDAKGYTLKTGGKSYPISVVVSGNERLVLSYEKDYFAVNSKVELPLVIAVDEAGKELSYSESLKKGDTVIEFSDHSFTPDSVGSYTYSVQADYFGKKIEKTATIEVVEKGSYKLRILAELGEEYGLKQACSFFGYEPEFTTERSYGRDSGSLKVTLNNDRTYNQQFSLRNLFIKDLSECNELYFYVYNESDYALTLSVNFGTFPIIAPRQWTKIHLKDLQNELILWSHAGVIKDNFTLKSVEGLTIADFFGDYWTGLGTFSLYFSSIYTWSDVKADDVIDSMEALPAELTQSDVYDFEDLCHMFKTLRELDQWENRAIYQNVARKYVDFLKKDNALIEENGVSVYFDRALGLKQASTIECNLALDENVLYNGKATTKVSIASSWQASVCMDFPIISDCTGYNEAYVYVRYDGDLQTLKATFSWENETDIVSLKKGEWVKVSFSNWYANSVSDQANVFGMKLDIFSSSDDLNEWAEMKDVTIHLSPVFVG